MEGRSPVPVAVASQSRRGDGFWSLNEKKRDKGADPRSGGGGYQGPFVRLLVKKQKRKSCERTADRRVRGGGCSGRWPILT